MKHAANLLRFIKELCERHIDYRMALIAALILASIVFLINLSYGYNAALIAALKQAIYTFLFAGLITRFNEKTAKKYDALHQTTRWLAFLLAVTCSTVMAVGFTLLVHMIKGTPEPLLSTLPTLLMAPIGFTILALRAQNESLKLIKTMQRINLKQHSHCLIDTP